MRRRDPPFAALFARGAWAALEDREWSLSRRKLIALAERLAAASPGARRRWLRNQPRAQKPRVVLELLSAAEEARFRSAARMVSLCRVAVDIAELLPAAVAPGEILADLRAECWAELANALRVNGEYPAAHYAWERAGGFAASGSGDLRLRAKILSRRASLLGEVGESKLAVADLREAVLLYSQLEDTHTAGCCLLAMGKLLKTVERAEEALVATTSAVAKLDQARDPELFLSALKNQMIMLADVGQPEAALALLMELKPRFSAAGQPELSRLRLLWIEGRLRVQAGDAAHGRALLQEVKSALAAQRHWIDTAEVCLELAASHAEAGETDVAERLSEEAHSALKGKGLQAGANRATALPPPRRGPNLDE